MISELAQHRLECLDCRQPGGWLPNTSQLYRPHTLNDDCWCVTPCELHCRMDVAAWKGLQETPRYI